MAWASPLKRRQFFEKYARDNGFDYRSPAAWYAQSRTKILSVKVFAELYVIYYLLMKHKGATKIIHYHKRRISRALLDLFPDIGLEKSRFKSCKFCYQYFVYFIIFYYYNISQGRCLIQLNSEYSSKITLNKADLILSIPTIGTPSRN